MTFLTNAYDRSRDVLRRFWPQGFGNVKHNYFFDYGYPEDLTFNNFYRMYCRGGLATAAVEKTIGKTWETNPAIWESEAPADTPAEAAIAKHFTKRNIWRGLMQADKRSMVGAYAGAIIIIRDGQALDQPVRRVRRIEDIAAIIPAWEGQLTVAEWDSVPTSETYGFPLYYQFDEQAVGNTANGVGRGSVRIHPDRILIFSEDGTVNGRSPLEGGYNSLLNAEKVEGAGGEGFWKSARGAPIIEAPQGLKPDEIIRGMGAASAEDAKEKLNDQVDKFQSGWDAALMIGGFTAKPLNIALPQPKEFWETAVMSFAASQRIPFKILVGNVTGERASTEDAQEWAQTNMSRRANNVVPVLNEFIDRLVRWGVLDAGKDWTVGWDDLTDASPDQKIDRATKMATINSSMMSNGEVAFLPDEIREAAGYAPSEDVEGFDEWKAEREERAAQEAEDARSEREEVETK